MYAVLCDPTDGSAIWAADRLRIRLGDVRLVHIDAFGLSTRLTLSLDEGRETASALLPDGSEFGPGTVGALLNRATRPPCAAVGRADAAYAAEEMMAITLAFLAAFGRAAVNQPHPAALAGREPGTAGWLKLAVIAGLSAWPWRMNEDGFAPLPSAASQVLVIGDAVFGCPQDLAPRAVALARLAGLDLLGINLAPDGRAVGATAVPDLSIGGEAGADALAALLMERA